MVEICEYNTGQVLFRTEADTLAGVTLADANLTCADLRGADLSGANLWRANLLNADLTGANLCGTILLGAILWGARLTGARWDATTRWPYEYPPPESPVSGECGHKGCELRVPQPCSIGRQAPLVSYCRCQRCRGFLRAAADLEREHARQLRRRAQGLRTRALETWLTAQTVWAAVTDASRRPNSASTAQVGTARVGLLMR